MNLIHRSIWNDQTGTFVAVSENTRSAGKRASSCTAAGGQARFGLNILAVSLMMACGASAWAQPAGGVVSAGSATIGGTAGNMTITQNTPNVAINWQSFGIKAGESVQFVQPGSNSVALNRVIGSDPSGIFGSLSSNGKVFLVNPNGILFGQGASVNVGGLVASTLAISDANFMANNYKFSGAGTGAVVNQGTINAADGGYVALLGANVSNQGVIAAQLGTVALAAGNAVTLDMAGDKLLNVTVDQGAVNALVENGGLLRADGGQVLMTTQAAGSLLANAVNNTGVVQAQTLVTGENGKIMLMGGMESGTVNVGGTLDASAPNGGNGGFIETSAAHVVLATNKYITTLASNGKTGMWLLDPVNWQIGNDGAVIGDETPASVTTSLASTDRTIVATNDITVAEALTWTTAQTLTLDAGHDVLVKATMTASTAGSGIVLIAGHDVNITAAAVTASGAGSTIKMSAGNDITTTATAITASANGASIDLSAGHNVSVGVVTADAGGSVKLSANNDVIVNGAIGADNGTVTLTADKDGTGPGVAGGTVKFVGTGAVSAPNTIIRFNPNGYDKTTTEIANYVTKVTGALDARAWVFVQGNNKDYDGTRAATLSFKGNPNDDVGGIVALSGSSALFNDKNVGTGKPITYTGYTVSGVNPGRFDLFDGGAGTTLANITPLAISGSITAANKVYDGNDLATITSRTLAGQIAGDTVSYIGGTATFSDKNVANGKTVTGVGLSLNGADAGNYTVNSRATTAANITPALLTVTANDQSKRYGQTFSFTGSEFTSSGLKPADTIATVTLASAGTAPTAHVAGSAYPITPSAATGGSFNPSNYTISYVNGSMVVTPAPLTVTANNQTKVYGTAFPFIGSEFTSSGLLNTDTIASATLVSAGTPAGASVVGSPYPIIPSAATGGTFTPSDYSINYINGAMTVTPLPLTVTASNVSKNYGDTPTLSAFTTSALANGETVGSVTETSPGRAATASVAGSPYVITPSSATGGTFTPTNYTITYVNGVLTVTPAPLTVTANDATKVYGQTATLPTSAFTSTGLKNDETISSVTETSPGTLATAPVGNSPYAVTITPGSATGGTFVPSNYTIAYLPGKLTVIPVVTVPPVVTPPVDLTPVDTTPVVTTPVDSTPVDTTPVDSPSAELTPLPDTPYEGPTVNPRVVVPTWMPVVTRPVTPPQLLTLAPPAAPIAVPVLEKPVETLVVQPVAPTPTPYLALKRQPKQDRN